MKLLTKAIERKLPALYGQEDAEDPIVYAHFFNPTSVGDWYITEGQLENDDFVMFGLCVILEPELGYVSLNELESFRGGFGLGIERDTNWTPVPLSTVRSRL